MGNILYTNLFFNFSYPFDSAILCCKETGWILWIAVAINSFASREGPSNKTISSLRPESKKIAFKVIPQYCTAHHVLEIKIYVIRRISARAFQEHGIFFSINGPGKEAWWSSALELARWPIFLLHKFGAQIVPCKKEKSKRLSKDKTDIAKSVHLLPATAKCTLNGWNYARDWLTSLKNVINPCGILQLFLRFKTELKKSFCLIW